MLVIWTEVIIVKKIKVIIKISLKLIQIFGVLSPKSIINPKRDRANETINSLLKIVEYFIFNLLF